jgi:predicted transposase YbfD/YdcC
MPQTVESSAQLLEHFKNLEDPRAEHLLEHGLLDIIGLTICAVICGADTWVDIENYGCAKPAWLKGFLRLPNGIPSHDTIARLFAALDPKALQECFLSWVRAVAQLSEGEVIAIDGKTLGHSYDTGGGKGAIHMVSAWARQNRLVLGQVKVDQKSNEITAIPQLLAVLDLHGGIVTIDAMGTQKDIAKQIIDFSNFSSDRLHWQNWQFPTSWFFAVAGTQLCRLCWFGRNCGIERAIARRGWDLQQLFDRPDVFSRRYLFQSC